MNEIDERVAQLLAHRACNGVEHDPMNGKLHGCCVVCQNPWPCEYAGTPPKPPPPTEKDKHCQSCVMKPTLCAGCPCHAEKEKP